MASKNVKDLLVKIRKNPLLLKELNGALIKIYSLSDVKLTLEEKKELITVIAFAITGQMEEENAAGGLSSYSVTL